MTTPPTTKREIGSKDPGAKNSPNVAESTRARARIPITHRIGKMWGLLGFLASEASLNTRRWWAFTARPLSLRALWRLSAVDPARVPSGSETWTSVWRWSNRTDRWLMFALIFLAPTGLTGPLRWIAARPTRRITFYALSALFISYVLI